MEMKIAVSDYLDIVERLKRGVDKLTDEAFTVCAEQMQVYAKQNAPWHDRTGNARRSLTGVTALSPLAVKEAAITGGMAYSPDLELDYDGRYSILMPTAAAFAPNLFGYIEKLTSDLGAYLDA